MTAATDRRALLALAAVMVLAIALRLIGVDYSLSYDEIASTRFAATPMRLLWSDWMILETNPPLYYALLRGWTTTFGSGDVALRLMSVVIGCVGVALVFALGRRAGGVRTGAVAAVLVAASAQNILYSQQVRGYVLGYAGGVSAIWGALAFLTAADRRARMGGLALYVGGSAVAVYAHTTFVLLPALVGAFVLARLLVRDARAWRPVAEWLAANAVVLALWAWWAHITLIQAQTRLTIGWIATPSLAYAVRMTLESYVPWEIGVAQYAVALLMVAAAAWGTWQWRDRPDRLLLPFLAVATPAVLYLISLKVPIFLPRTVYWASAPFLVTVAAGIAALRPRALFAGGVAGAVAATLAGWLVWYPTREIEPWRANVATLQQRHPGATVLASGKGPVLALRRYCVVPVCDLTIVGLASPSTDAWASAFPVAGMIPADGARTVLRRRGSLVAVRWMGADPMAGPAPGATAVPVALPGRGNIGAAYWTTR